MFFLKNKYLSKIESYNFPSYLRAKVQDSLGMDLSLSDWEIICQGFKQYCRAWVKSGYKGLAMPSQSVDALWHEMILNTREYATFCNMCLGKFLHHTSRDALDKGELKNIIEIWQTWQMCAQDMNVADLDFYTLGHLGPLFDSDRKIFINCAKKCNINKKYNGFFWFSSYNEITKFENQLHLDVPLSSYQTGNIQEVFNYLKSQNYFKT